MTTLDGDIAESSGVMQGGFRQRKKTGYGFKEKEVANNITECVCSFITKLMYS